MRQKQVIEQKPGVRKTQNKEPMAEGIQKKKKRRPQNFFTKMSDSELINYAKKFIKENGIKNRNGLRKVDKSLEYILRKRKLLDAAISREGRNWRAISDIELISFAERFIKENEIKSRRGLEKADRGLYHVLKKRNLIETVPSGKWGRTWSLMSDIELISFAERFIKENEIKSRRDLEKVDKGLSMVLRKRNLLNAAIPDKIYKNWSSKNGAELISFAKKIMEENKIENRTGLSKADPTLYDVLRKRNLLDAVIPEKREQRDWSSMTGKELISYAKIFIQENKIENRKALGRADSGLYQVLRKRKLLDTVIPEKYGRDWSSMTDKRLISYAKTYIKENDIKNRSSLSKTDHGLYRALIKRKLLSVVIPNKQNRPRGFFTKMSDKELVSYTKEIIEENGIKNRKSLQKGDNSLYEILRKRNLLDAVIPEKQEHRKWFSMNNNELVQFAKKFIEENKIKNRKDLTKADPGLHDVLIRRNLLNLVFSDIEEAKKTEAIKQVVDAMKEFGEKE